MYKNQLQELAQRSCFNLPSYACIREGPDHAPRFKASVNFNGEIFESPNYCSTLRHAEHAAAEVALNVLSTRGPSRSITARVLDETGVYKNLLQETAHRAGLNLPVYTTVRSGPGHLPVFTCTVKIAGMNFTGLSAKTKKQAEKNAAIAAWSALKIMPDLGSLSQTNKETCEEEDQVVVSRILSNFRSNDENRAAIRVDQNRGRRRILRGNYRDNSSLAPSSSLSNNPLLQFQQWNMPTQKQNCFLTLLPPPPPRTTSKILPPPPTLSRDNSPSPYRSNRSIPEQVRSPPLEGQRDGERNGPAKKKPIEKEGPCNSDLSNVYGESSIYSSFPLPNVEKLNTMRKVQFGPPTPSPIVRHMHAGGFHPHRIAPAVQIRSVIPVCAAPPPSVRPTPQSNHPTLKETSSSKALGASTSTTTSVPTHTEAGVSSTSSMFNKLQL